MKKEQIARTGRVQSWIDDPEARLPVSCTVFSVDDSCEGSEGIEASWRFVSHALRNAAGVAVHLSKLRPKGTENGKGLVASGPVSFAKIYSTLNEVLRRGGHYKNGACTVALDLNHADILEFIEAPRSELPWVKRCVCLEPLWWYEASREVKDALLLGIKKGDIWLSKVRYSDKHFKGERLFSNVCLEIFVQSRGTCLLQHINSGACLIEEIKEAFVEGMSSLCKLHAQTGVGETGEYLPPERDRQVGLGILGLANLLAHYGVTYKELGRELSSVAFGGGTADSNAGKIARALEEGINAAAKVAEEYKMDRAFCIAPTASCSYNYKDLDGYTTAPEIAPPIAREIDRDSGTFGVQSYNYGPNIEIASEVGWTDYCRVANALVKIYQRTGLFHGYSFNTWSDMVTYDDHFIENWLHSPQTSMYYALQVQPDTLRKDDPSSLLDEDEYKDIFNPVLFEEQLEDKEFCPVCAE